MSKVMRRPFAAPPDDARCEATRKPLADGSLARCMRRATVGNLCAQHAKLARAEREFLEALR